MIRLGAIALGLSMVALWLVPFAPGWLALSLRPLAVGMLTTGLALLLMARDRPCPTCLAAATAQLREPEAILVEDEPTPTPAGVPIVDGTGRELDEDEADELLDELDEVLATTDPGPIYGGTAQPLVFAPQMGRPYVGWTVQDPATTAPIPVVRDPEPSSETP